MPVSGYRPPRRRQGGSSRRRGRARQVGSGLARPQPTPPVKRPVTQPTAQYTPVAGPAVMAPVQGPSSAATRANAQQAWQAAQTGNRDAIWRAAMQLGDPTVIAKLQKDPNYAGFKFAQDPNSVFAQLGRQEKQGLEETDVNANAANAFFSGFRLQDRGKLSDEFSRQRLAGGTAWQDQLAEFAKALAGAQGEYTQAMADADQMDIDAALANPPVGGAGGNMPLPAGVANLPPHLQEAAIAMIEGSPASRGFNGPNKKKGRKKGGR